MYHTAAFDPIRGHKDQKPTPSPEFFGGKTGLYFSMK